MTVGSILLSQKSQHHSCSWSEELLEETSRGESREEGHERNGTRTQRDSKKRKRGILYIFLTFLMSVWTEANKRELSLAPMVI